MESITAPGQRVVREISRPVAALSRQMGFSGTLTFGVLCIGLAVSGLLPVSTLVGLWPGVNILGALSIALALCLLHATVYAAIGAAVPSSGADYVLVSRTLSAPLAFASSLTFVFASTLVAGSFIAFIPKAILPTLFQSIGIVSENPDLLALASIISAPQGVVVIGTLLVVVAFTATLVSPRTLNRIFEIGILVGLLAWLVLYAQLAFSAPDSFPSAWDRFMGAGSYESRISMAVSLGMVVEKSSSTTLFAGLLTGLWVFFGSFAPTFFSGEVKKPEKNILFGSWASLGLAWVIIAGGILLLQRLIPSEWLAAESYLHQAGYQGLTMPWVNYYAAVLQPNQPLIFLVALACMYTVVNMVQTYMVFTSRIVLAWAKDGLLPNTVQYIHPTRRNPVFALLISAILVEIGLMDAAQNGLFSNQRLFVFLVLVTQILPLTALMLLPFLKRDWFNRTPALVRSKIGPVPVISLISLATLVYILLALWAAYQSPNAGIFDAGSLTLLAALFLSGLLGFSLRRSYLLTRGRAEEWLVKQIPVEESEK